MKNLKLLSILAALFIMVFFSSCDNNNNKDLPVSLSLDKTTARDSVFMGNTCIIEGVAKAAGQIKMIQIFQSFNWAGGVSEVEVAGTGIYTFPSDTTTTYRFSLSVPNIKATKSIRIQVTDKSGNTASSAYTITVRQSNIISYLNVPMGGWDSNFGSALDADTGTPYGSSQLGEVGSIVDIFFDHAVLASHDLDAVDFYPQYYSGARFPETGTKFTKTNFSSSDFDGITNDELFSTMDGTVSTINIKEGDVIFFQTKSGRKGLLKVKSMSDPLGDLVVDLKVQK
ncbi:MAG: hypothetical protein Q8862_04655 [Bacteroidota bacterium]|nr:hypothetical protein [Bacteroidota bacterium]MDP4205044.1 hypothetical protein [Bacteroidota bacterium]